MASTTLSAKIPSSARSPARPPARSFFGHFSEFLADPLASMEHWARTREPLIQLSFLGKPVFLLNHPSFVEEALITHNAQFIKPLGLQTPLMRRLVGEGLLRSEGDFWKRQRRLAQPSFHKERILGYASNVIALADQTANTFRPGETLDVNAEAMRLTLRVAALTLFDTDVGADIDEVGEAMNELVSEFPRQWSPLGILASIFPSRSSLRVRGAIARIEAVVTRIIRERLKTGHRSNDLLSMLLDARDDDGNRMSDRQLRDEVMTFLFAGHETSATALSWAWQILSRRPHCERKLRMEWKTVLGDRRPGPEDWMRLPYTESVIKETMRLYPPVWLIGREAKEEVELGGHCIPKRGQLMVSQWVAHRDPRYFDDPETFRPERWTPEFTKALPKLAYFPFSAGPRVCIGYVFAMMEAVLILATIGRRIRFEPVPGIEARPYPSITLRPDRPILMRVRPASEERPVLS